MEDLPLLSVMVGLPRSGKSTVAQELANQGAVIVCPDSIRLALHGQAFNAKAEPIVWATCQIMVRALFLTGHRWLVLDATNTTRQRRAMWLKPEWETVYQEITTDVNQCIRRALRDTKKSDAELAEFVQAIRRMHEQYEKPDLEAELAAVFRLTI
jgi:predicted kinase